MADWGIMGFRSSWRWALFICCLVTNHYLICATLAYPDPEIQATIARYYREKYGDHFDYEEDDSPKASEGSTSPHRNGTSGLARHSKAQKKFFFSLFLLIVSVVTAVVATTVETIYDIKGCCGLVGYKYLCNFENKFKNRKEDIVDRSKKVDEGVKKALGFKSGMEELAKDIGKMWSRLEEILSLQKQILKTIDPKIDEALNMKIKAIKQEADVDSLTLNKLDQATNPTIRNLNIAGSWIFGPGLSGIDLMSRKAWERIKTGKIFKSLKADYATKLFKAAPTRVQNLLGFTDDVAKGFLKTTAISRFGVKSVKAMKFMKVLKGAGPALTIVSIGFDLYNLISTLVGCSKKVGQAKDAMAKLDNAEKDLSSNERDLRELFDELIDYRNNYLIPNIRSEGLQRALEGVWEIINGIQRSVKTWDARGCVRRIPQYKRILKYSNSSQSISTAINEFTNGCLKKLTYTMSCRLRTLRMIRQVIDRCQAGKHISRLYEEAVTTHNANSAECLNHHGEPYTSKDDVKASLRKAARAQGFSAQCRLNRLSVQMYICKNKATQSAEQIAQGLKTEMNLSVSEPERIQVIMDACKDDPSSQLESVKIQSICEWKRSEISDADIAELEKVTEEQVNAVKCPGMDL
ncbi:uncharacterized protein LOC116617804 [Nematostella vectensis]|uniref:uncharacterized protein LOC116617804 n=1 Tax=Nematostella vectensis TaxID=45351 RepID=UPI002077426B|nr:uncharacterized protein LOC116617804 [Nematostella vectensis]XP_048584721.1 uncharacterized protein LOC116617804 [Nematostella vectensis]XP_048584722.1 uncharacterized protein LOC116617804 [Nematostella vectensis]XP_048584723.1 uncharacterized protein LOC116617804 [Nematostella vectensis]XP_048584724.1 uncharacterized protein LOC116617804 [Nematostella vectensis]